jgi:formylglycine-generating enzyme required for sulfatase activity
VNGDVGQHIVPGSGKRLVWDAGKEMPNQFGVKYRYRIGASDQWLGAPGMALIPAGPFQMGDARVAGPFAFPVHTVTVSAFAMDKWEVSIELWESVRAWGNAHGYDLVAGGSFGAKHPVHSVSWWDVVKWCNARSEKEGKVPAYYVDAVMIQVYRSGDKLPAGVKWDAGYRLPTEAEWEKAGRGGVAGKLYPWGTDEISPTLANYNESNKNGTTPIGSYGANGYGLYDMAGNVWEWTWDWYGDYSSTAQTDPRGPSSGSDRVIRGGMWFRDWGFCRVAFRRYYGPGDDIPGSGFRSVLPPGSP